MSDPIPVPLRNAIETNDTWTRDLSAMMIVWFVAVVAGGFGLLAFGDVIASL